MEHSNDQEHERSSPPLEGWQSQKIGIDGVVTTEIDGIPIIGNSPRKLPYNPSLKKMSIARRKAGVLSEVLFWKEVHQRKFHGIDFDRQRIIGNYIVDFYVKRLGMVVEIEHSNTSENESLYSYLDALSIKVFAVKDWEIKNNISEVMRQLAQFIVANFSQIGEQPPRPSGTPPEEGNSPSA